MGVFGIALYSDDTACDVREEFISLLVRHRDPAVATSALLRSWEAQIADADDGPVFWLATQWRHGCLGETVKARAIRVIENKEDLHRWEGPDLTRRQSILATLKNKLLSVQPKARIPRRRRQVEVLSTQVTSPDGRAAATAFELAASPYPESPKTQVIVEMESSGSRGGGGVLVATCEYTDVQLDWLGPDTLKITYPSRAVVIEQAESTFFGGRTIRIVPGPRDE